MMKKEVAQVDAIPSKRLFWSIIADYNLNRSICELIDNALDQWTRHSRKDAVTIKVDFDIGQQSIYISDNAGGIKKDEIVVVVSPGQTTNDTSDEIIGIFGVGTKRAVVALAEDVKIKTRFNKEKTHLIEFNNDWLEDEDWELPVYEVDNIEERTTIIELNRLRIKLTEDSILQLREHLSATYAMFLMDRNVSIRINNEELKPITFENWAYPPDYFPRKYNGDIIVANGRTVKIEVTAGLTKESSPISAEYGVYFYCNNRLVARGLKTYDVGFTRGLAGAPHPNISLTRVIVYLNGDARDIPWNSSKSDINVNHYVFIQLRDWLTRVVKDYASLSRRLEGEWPEKVFKYTTGSIVNIKIDNIPEASKSYLPPLPKARIKYGDRITQLNKKVAKDKPWSKGLYESVIAVDSLMKQKIEQKGRISLIVLDSTLEIAFKEFLVNESGKSYSDAALLNLFKKRTDVQNEVQNYGVNITIDQWKKINHFYRLRCKLIHERATVGISDNEIIEYRELVQAVLKSLFKLRF